MRLFSFRECILSRVICIIIKILECIFWRKTNAVAKFHFYERERTTSIARHTITNARPQAAKFFTYFTRNLPVIDIPLFEETYCVFKTFQLVWCWSNPIRTYNHLEFTTLGQWGEKCCPMAATDLLKLQLLKRSHIFQVWSSMHHVFAQPQTFFHVVICSWNLIFF